MAPIFDVRNRPPGLSPYFSPERNTDQAALLMRVNRRTGSSDAQHFFEFGAEPGKFQQRLSELEIERLVVLAKQHDRVFVENDTVAALTKAHPHYVGIGAVDPITFGVRGALEEVRRAIGSLDLKGINMDPGLLHTALYPNDRRLHPIYAECEALGVPIWLMTGPFAGPDLEYTSPSRISEIAREYPRLSIVLGHGCYPFATEAVGLAFRYENVYLSPDIYMFMPGAEAYQNGLSGFLQDQFLFGTGYPFREMGQTIREFRGLGLPRATEEKCLWYNAARLLNRHEAGL